MARGGYIQPEMAVKKLFKATGKRDMAKHIIVDALISGALATRGRRILEWKRDPVPGGFLRDLAADDPTLEPLLADLDDIPEPYWSELKESDLNDAHWREGSFRARYFDHNGYQEVVFNEKDINALVAINDLTKGTVRRPKARLRHSSWDDWVAAIAILAAEQRISGQLSRQTVLDLINAKLQAWGLEGKEDSTVGPAAQAVLLRFRSDPPVPQIRT